jgi:hypothetical protein
LAEPISPPCSGTRWRRRSGDLTGCSGEYSAPSASAPADYAYDAWLCTKASGSVRHASAYGDTINIAARLKTANKQLGTRICVSENVARKVAEFRGRPIGDLVLRGRKEPLRAFEPLRPEQRRTASIKGYFAAFAKLEAGDPAALAAFAAEVGKSPDDQLAAFHLKRLLNGATGSRIEMD